MDAATDAAAALPPRSGDYRTPQAKGGRSGWSAHDDEAGAHEQGGGGTDGADLGAVGQAGGPLAREGADRHLRVTASELIEDGRASACGRVSPARPARSRKATASRSRSPARREQALRERCR